MRTQTALTRFALPFLLLLSIARPAAAQERGTISGKVSDRKSGHALAFASVTVAEAKRGVLTDSEGQFVVSGLPAGTYNVRVQFLGYKAHSRAGVAVTAGKATTVNFALEEVVV